MARSPFAIDSGDVATIIDVQYSWIMQHHQATLTHYVESGWLTAFMPGVVALVQIGMFDFGILEHVDLSIN